MNEQTGPLRDAAVRLRRFLDGVGYDTYAFTLRGLGYFVSPWPQYYEFSRKIRRLPEDMRTIYQLFYLGEAIALEKVENLLGRDLTSLLKEVAFLQIDKGQAAANSIGVVPYMGHYLVASLPPFYPTCRDKRQRIYLGRDSYGLTVASAPLRGTNGLDLCTGCGVQAILLSHNVRHVIGTELVPEAANLARFNAMLNGVDDQVEIQQGDLYRRVEGRKFDVIVANPPFLPIPPNLEYPIATNGGPDGFQVMGRTLEGLPEYLEDNGTFVAIGEAIGDEHRPFFLSHLEALSKKGFKIEFLSISREISELIVNLLAEVTSVVKGVDSQRMAPLFKEHMASLRGSFYYHYIIRAIKNGSPGLSIVKIHGDWQPENTPVPVEFDQLTLTQQQVYMGVLANLGEGYHRFLHGSNGVKTVKQIVSDSLPKEEPSQHAFLRMLQQALNYYDELEALGLVVRKQS